MRGEGLVGNEDGGDFTNEVRFVSGCKSECKRGSRCHWEFMCFQALLEIQRQDLVSQIV